jgi:hypothetical protein
VTGTEPDSDKPDFEALLAQVLITDEKAQTHQASKTARGSARKDAVSAKANFERNRERPPKQRRRQAKREA